MPHSIQTIYVIHHSHTDIGYTDLQEKVIDCQVDNLRVALRLLQKPGNEAFRWNCETYFCVERFLATASEEEKAQFFGLAKAGHIGISASYLNFCDLVPCDVLKARTAELCEVFRARGIEVKTAMNADINGISMGQRNALLDNGVEFLFTNIHTHHGMYPLYQNQTAYRWEDSRGRSLLVWNGEHYNLGNALGIKPNEGVNYLGRRYVGATECDDAIDTLEKSIDVYLAECEAAGYPHDFILSSVSGEFSDNAPPNDEVLRTVEAYNARNTGVQLKMVSLQELYAEIRDRLRDVPIYRGDLTDWWANGVGSTPYAVKHFREALRMYRLAGKLDADVCRLYPDPARQAQDNLLLYAEHTWGHSATITNPYDTMVTNLDMRKQSYASKAHEAAAMLQNRAMMRRGGVLRCYARSGCVSAVNTSDEARTVPVEYFIETSKLEALEVVCEDGRAMEVQLSSHPRGVCVTFTDAFEAGETKRYRYTQKPGNLSRASTRHAYCGAEAVRDIENRLDLETCQLPYRLESDAYLLEYAIGEGFTAWIDKQTGANLLEGVPHPLFTPLYEVTEIRHGVYEERRRIGRNIRGAHSVLHRAKLESVDIVENGPVFILAEFGFVLPGTTHCAVRIKLYRHLPRIDYSLQLAKTLSEHIESVFMPQTLGGFDHSTYLKKGEEPFRPGVDQIPGTCMEYYMSDCGAALCGDDFGYLLSSPDVPLFYMGEMKSHPIRLCDGDEANNCRPLYSWVMNNTWETNFKMDLSGFGEFRYRIERTNAATPEACFARLEDEPDAFAYLTE